MTTNDKQESKTTMKTKVYNLIILDQSGSMSYIKQAAISGFNENLDNILEAHEKYGETQEQFVSLMVFSSGDIRYIYNKVPVSDVQKLTEKEYRPHGCTPLFDAMGQALTELRDDISDMENATASVTVITDGMENASQEYNGASIKALVDDLQQNEGWAFSYIGANQDVETVSSSLSIKTSLTFDFSTEGMGNAWKMERNSKMRYFDSLNDEHDIACCMSSAERKKSRAMSNLKNSCYLQRIPEDRITPENITTLQPNEIFVFGSSISGDHAGGAARYAVEHFGATPGTAKGIQGQSYAIPTTNVALNEIGHEVDEFIRYAMKHKDLKFLVTRIGCGNAGYNVQEIAHLFTTAYKATNISLPREFWEVIL